MSKMKKKFKGTADYNLTIRTDLSPIRLGKMQCLSVSYLFVTPDSLFYPSCIPSLVLLFLQTPDAT